MTARGFSLLNRDLGGIKTVDSPFDSGRMRMRVDFSERSYKIEFASGA
jgi:hypothetical protein